MVTLSLHCPGLDSTGSDTVLDRTVQGRTRAVQGLAGELWVIARGGGLIGDYASFLENDNYGRQQAQGSRPADQRRQTKPVDGNASPQHPQGKPRVKAIEVMACSRAW